MRAGQPQRRPARHQARGPEASVLAVDPLAGHAFVATEGDDTITMLDAGSGAVVRTTPVGLVPVALATDPRTAHVFTGGPAEPGGALGPGRESRPVAGRVSMLDTRSGALLCTVRVETAPMALAMDARSGRPGRCQRRRCAGRA